MKVFTIVIAVFSLCLGLGGCGDSANDRYFPLEEGLYWQYDMKYTTMDGTFKGVYAVENLAPQLRDGEKVYVRRLLDGTNNYIRIDDAGILLAGREKTVDRESNYTPEKHYIFRFPLDSGTTWEDITFSRLLIKTGPPQKTEFHIVARVPVTLKIESMTDTVKVPAGSFSNCMRVHVSGDAFTNAGNYVGLTVVAIDETNWYAPDVGLVKSIRTETTKSRALDKGEMTLELREFRD